MPIPPSEDDRIHPTPATKARMQARGLSFEVPANPLTVVMEDDIMHTINHPVCADPACICYRMEELAAEQRRQESKPKKRRVRTRTWSAETPAIAAPLNGTRPFQLMR